MSNQLNVTTRNDREIVLTRTFDAPRKLVWEAMSKPEILKQWLVGPPGWAMTLCEDDLRAGGHFRWGWSGPEGAEIAMHGVYREVTSPERIVRTETFDFGCDVQSGEQLGTLVLAENGDKTNLTLTVLYPSKEARDGALASGMDKGVGAGYNRLDEILTARAASHQ